MSPETAAPGTGATGVKLANPFSPGDSVTVSTPEKPVAGGAAPVVQQPVVEPAAAQPVAP